MIMDQTAAAKAVMIEVMNILGAFRGQIVLIGGWVPDLRFPGRGHVGSLDVDLAIGPEAAAENAYASIMARLREGQYAVESNPTRFYRTVPGARDRIKVDVVTRQYRAGERMSAALVNELRVNSLRGVDLAFECCDEIQLSGIMPDGSHNTVRAMVVRPEAFILLKAFALDERKKAKDAYDVAFTLRNYEPSLQVLADRVAPLVTHGLGQEAWSILTNKFQSIDSVGPLWAADVAATEAGLNREQEQQAAFQDSQSLFEAVSRLLAAT
jgi:hypothetical protein